MVETDQEDPAVYEEDEGEGLGVGYPPPFLKAVTLSRNCSRQGFLGFVRRKLRLINEELYIASIYNLGARAKRARGNLAAT